MLFKFLFIQQPDTQLNHKHSCIPANSQLKSANSQFYASYSELLYLLKATMTSAAALFKVYIENMPEALNTKKDIDEYIKEFWKDFKEKAKEAKAADKAAKAQKPKRKKGFDKDGNPKEKRAPTAYNIFLKEKYAEIKEANPELDRTQIFAEAGRLWQEAKALKANQPKDDEMVDVPEVPDAPKEEEDISEIQEAPSDDDAPKNKRVRKAKKAKE